MPSNSNTTDNNKELYVSYYETPPTYQEFLEKHLIPNTPCLIGPELIKNWKARKEWIVPNDNCEFAKPQSKPNYSYLKQQYGSTEGQVAMCNQRYFTDQCRTEMSFKEFVDVWEADDGKESVYYLKDIHLQKTFPNDTFYEAPHVFEDDWLNEYWLENSESDYRFVYLGGHSTFTTFHADVYRSYSWSSNICGIKKWTLFPPGQEELYKDKFGNFVYDIRDIDKTQFPLFEQAKRIVIYQKDGETLFVPSNWFHQVENIGAAISINHNWINSCNIASVYQSMKLDLHDCVKAICHLKDDMTAVEFREQCQGLLLRHSGWDWNTFLSILSSIVNNRTNGKKTINEPNLDFQMKSIAQVLETWEQDEPQLLEYFKQQEPNLLKTFSKLKDNIAQIKLHH